MSVSFLSMLLRASIFLETTVACRLDLEKRMGLQLGQAVLDDLLIPSFTFEGDTEFDIDTVHRILMNYLEHEIHGNRTGYNTDDDYISPPRSDMDRVGRLMESYLAEIASDPNLTIARFISLAELVPQQARINEDGMYRAIDIYLKAHPSLTDMERKKICSLMDSQKLSREACAHAAQNDRLPVQTVVQVLYSEQQRIRDTAMSSFTGGESPALSLRSTYSTTYRSSTPTDFEVSRLQRENDDLRMQLLRMGMQLKEAEKPLRQIPSAEKPPLPKKSFMNSLSKKLGRLYPFSESVKPAKGRAKPPKDRRHSIS
ncbi:BTB/POZ domain-containing protein [Canna indica]|uniref:BTB/POZ domain-containing protein n=1 Tax=Canna indica TaxID=4628 RepID=A0AAQ3JNV4_9LILI|nr:BTB/POZ domain-containing protein [Canna indica]